MMLFQRCKKHIANPLIETEMGLICTICGPIYLEDPKQKNKKLKKKTGSLDGFSELTCSLCQKVKKRKKLKGYDYVDELGNKWLRRRCPDCKPAMIYKQNIKRPRKLKDRACPICNKMFRPKNSRHVVCTRYCTKTGHSVHYKGQSSNEIMITTISNKLKAKPGSWFGKEEASYEDLPVCVGPVTATAAQAAPKKKSVRSVTSECLYCGSILRSDRPRSYCNKKCANKYQYKYNDAFKARLKDFKAHLKSSPSYKTWQQYKRHYKTEITSKAKLHCVSWKDLDVYFTNCPPNHEVQLVVPLCDENVCGLFVPWNLRYVKQ